jgi:predicted transcriptional regulator
MIEELKQIRIAKKVLEYLKENNLNEFKGGKKIGKKTNLTPHQIGSGVKFLYEKGIIRPTSNKKWEIVGKTSDWFNIIFGINEGEKK